MGKTWKKHVDDQLKSSFSQKNTSPVLFSMCPPPTPTLPPPCQDKYFGNPQRMGWRVWFTWKMSLLFFAGENKQPRTAEGRLTSFSNSATFGYSKCSLRTQGHWWCKSLNKIPYTVTSFITKKGGIKTTISYQACLQYSHTLHQSVRQCLWQTEKCICVCMWCTALAYDNILHQTKL